MKRFLFAVLASVSLILAGCSSPTTKAGHTQTNGTAPAGSDTPAATGPSTQPLTATANVLPNAPWNVLPRTQRDWDDPNSYPWQVPGFGKFWVTDQPQSLQPLAFGVLPVEREPGTELTINGYELAATLPEVPTELAVYVAGRYPDSAVELFNRIVAKGENSWEFVPEYSFIQYSNQHLVGGKTPVTTTRQAEEQAVQLLNDRGLLLPDAAMPTTYEQPDGTRQILFYRRINGVPIYPNKGLAITINRDGQITNVIGRRRPLLSESKYPLRSPEEAWRLLREGRGRTMNVSDGASWEKGTIERFVVKDVNIAYVETEVVSPQQIVQPYYVFRNDQGRTLYVPAVADPYATRSS